MARQIEQVKSTHANAAPNRWVDRLRRLLNHPGVLAGDPSPNRVLACTPAIAVPDSPAHLDRNVVGRGRDHGSLARRLAL